MKRHRIKTNKYGTITRESAPPSRGLASIDVDFWSGDEYVGRGYISEGVTIVIGDTNQETTTLSLWGPGSSITHWSHPKETLDK